MPLKRSRYVLGLFVGLLCLGTLQVQASSITSAYLQSVYAFPDGAPHQISVTSGPSTVAPPQLNESSSSNPYGCGIYDQSATSQLYGDAAPDTFHGYVQSSVSVTQTSGAIPCTTYGTSAAANLAFTALDDFFFQSTTLGFGSTVSFQVTANLHSILTGALADCSHGEPQPAAQASFQMLYNNGNNYGARMFDPLVHSTCGTGVGSDDMSFTGTFQSTIGADFAVQTIFSLQSDDSLPLMASATSENVVDASDTGDISVQVLTPGVTFSSGSGALYQPTSSVPEPPTLFLFGTGLMGLGILKRRR